MSIRARRRPVCRACGYVATKSKLQCLQVFSSQATRCTLLPVSPWEPVIATVTRLPGCIQAGRIAYVGALGQGSAESLVGKKVK
jgi:hypothetical protein